MMPGGKADPYIEIRKAHGLVKSTVEKPTLSSSIGTVAVGASLGAALTGLLASNQLSSLICGGLLGAGMATSCLFLKADVTLKPFQTPQEGVYLGHEDKASLIYDGKGDYQELSLEPKWKTIEFNDLSL
jgi:hypothetical protein